MSLRVMLVDVPASHIAMLEQGLEQAGYQRVATHTGNSGLLKRVTESQPELLVIHLHKADAAMLESLRIIQRDYPCPIVLFTEDADAAVIPQAIRAGVTAYVVDGLTSHRLRPVIEVALARFAEMQALRQELAKTKTSLEERKVIDRAKGLIMQQRRISETDAYTALRKAAMAGNKRLIEVAREVISVMELLRN